MQKYKIGDLIGCVTDGLIFHYCKFVNEGNSKMKFVWAYKLLYDDIPSHESICTHFNFLFQALN